MFQNFDIRIYYNNEKNEKTGHYKKIVGKLIRNHEIFNRKKKNTRIIIITFITILCYCYNPSALKLYRIGILGFTIKSAINYLIINDPV